jgi:glucose-6-phosphate 1-dehydrogenase
MGGVTGDVFVVFGITGDLAKEMTFRSLYRLERRGLLGVRSLVSRSTTGRSPTCVDTCGARSGLAGRRSKGTVFDRLAARFAYVQRPRGTQTRWRLALALDAIRLIAFDHVPR